MSGGIYLSERIIDKYLDKILVITFNDGTRVTGQIKGYDDEIEITIISNDDTNGATMIVPRFGYKFITENK